MAEPLFFEDREAADLDDEGQILDKHGQTNQEKEGDEKTSRGAVWVDEDDDEQPINLLEVPRRKKLRKSLSEKEVSGTEYSKRVRELYSEKGATQTAALRWAQLPSGRRKRPKDATNGDQSADDDASDGEDDLPQKVRSLLQSTRGVLKKRSRQSDANARYGNGVSLQSGVLDLYVVPHANREDPNRAEARCLEFHSSGKLLLTAGFDKTLRLFHIDGKRNAKIQGVHIQNFPMYSAKFTGGGTEVVMTGRRKYFQCMDLNSGTVTTVKTLVQYEERSWENIEVSSDGEKIAFIGQRGKVVIVSNKSKREVGQLRHNGRVVSAAFAARGENEHQLYSVTVDGTVYLWDVRKMACVDKHRDEGAVHSTSIAASPDHYALGSDSGIVNVYDRNVMGSKTSSGGLLGTRTEKPLKVFENLTTEIDHIQFNGDGQLMAFASHEVKGAIRIAHIPTMTVVRNWPSTRTNVRRVCSMAFSPGGGYLAVGSDNGDAHLLRINAYPAR